MGEKNVEHGTANGCKRQRSGLCSIIHIPFPQFITIVRTKEGLTAILRLRASVILLLINNWHSHHLRRRRVGCHIIISEVLHGMCRVKLCMCIFRYYIKIGLHISVIFFRSGMTSVWGWLFLGFVCVRCPERPWVVGGGEEASSLLIQSPPQDSFITRHSFSFLPLNNKSGIPILPPPKHFFAIISSPRGAIWTSGYIQVQGWHRECRSPD